MKTVTSVVIGAALWLGGQAVAGSPGSQQVVPEAYTRNLEASAQDQVCRASRALAAAQLDEGWSWQRGERKAQPNVTGLVAHAVAKVAPECGTGAAVERYARSSLERHSRGEFLYDPDVEALAEAARLTGNPRYLEVAKEAFARRYQLATGEEIVERWFMVGRDRRLIGFEAAAAIRAALAVGERAKAEEIATAAARVGKRWVEGWDPRGFLTTSRGAMLEALSQLGAKSPLLASFERDLVHHLLLTQASDGSWEGRNTQSTAYAVRGLLAAGDEAAAASARLGTRWLRLTQLQDGSWATFNDLVPEPFVGDVVHEVTAEVLLALR